jgi:hypothetical protein
MIRKTIATKTKKSNWKLIIVIIEIAVVVMVAIQPIFQSIHR